VALIATFAVLIAAKSTNLIGPTECRSDPVALSSGPEVQATMTVPAGTACSFWVKEATASFDQLEITSAPQHGAVTARGRTGVIYRPEPQFTGDDVFALALRGESVRREGASLIRVSVTVK